MTWGAPFFAPGRREGAAQQPAAQTMNNFPQVFRLQPFQIPVDGFPIRQFLHGRFFFA